MWLGYDQPEGRGVAGEMSAKEQWRSVCVQGGQDARDTLSQGASCSSQRHDCACPCLPALSQGI